MSLIFMYKMLVDNDKKKEIDVKRTSYGKADIQIRKTI